MSEKRMWRWTSDSRGFTALIEIPLRCDPSEVAEKVSAINPQERVRDAAEEVQFALITVMAWLTNVNSYTPNQVWSQVAGALAASGYDKNEIDDYALALLRGTLAAPAIKLAEEAEG